MTEEEMIAINEQLAVLQKTKYMERAEALIVELKALAALEGVTTRPDNEMSKKAEVFNHLISSFNSLANVIAPPVYINSALPNDPPVVVADPIAQATMEAFVADQAAKVAKQTGE